MREETAIRRIQLMTTVIAMMAIFMSFYLVFDYINIIGLGGFGIVQPVVMVTSFLLVIVVGLEFYNSIFERQKEKELAKSEIKYELIKKLNEDDIVKDSNTVKADLIIESNNERYVIELKPDHEIDSNIIKYISSELDRGNIEIRKEEGDV